jgi:HD-GYP domain-containing protein (c-di-GMP phosphodiesterase class II)
MYDSEGKVAVSRDTALSPELVSDLKSRSVKGLFAESDDFLTPEKRAPGLDHVAIMRRVEEIRSKADIQKPVSEAIRREALALARETIGEAHIGRPIDYGAIDDLARVVCCDMRSKGFRAVSNPRPGDPYDYLPKHSVNVMMNMLALATKVGLDDDDARKLAVGAFLHDIGKVSVGNTILVKPGKLDEHEFEEMRKHPLMGLRIVMRGLDVGDDACRVVLHHHERFDGRGYPMKLGRDSISVGGRMMAVIDAYDAMTNDRIYAKKLTGHQALSRIIAGSGAQFDPRCAHNFLTISGAYPDGSVVELNTGEISVVTSQTPGSIVSPSVEVFFTPSRRALPKPRMINLSADSSRYIKGEMAGYR